MIFFFGIDSDKGYLFWWIQVLVLNGLFRKDLFLDVSLRIGFQGMDITIMAHHLGDFRLSVMPNCGLVKESSKGWHRRAVRESPQNPLNSSLGIIIIICPDNCILYCKVTLLAECASGDSALISGADEAGVMKGILYWPVDGRLVNGRSVLTWWWCLFLFKDWWQIWTSHSDVCEC